MNRQFAAIAVGTLLLACGGGDFSDGPDGGSSDGPDGASDANSNDYPVITPTFSPPAGTYSSSQSVTISTITEGASIHYSLDGTEPTESSSLYSGAITISSTLTIKAKAFKAGLAPSSTTTALYSIEEEPIGQVKIYDSMVSTIWDDGRAEFFSTAAGANIDNWIQIPYGTTSHTFIGDMVIENEQYYMLFFDSYNARPSMYGKKDDGSTVYNCEIYITWNDPTDNNRIIWNVWQEINDAVIINENSQGTADVTIVANTYNGIRPGWNVHDFTIRSNSYNLQIAPRNDLEASPDNDHEYRVAIHHASGRVSTTLPNTITEEDFVVDKLEYDWLVYPEQTTISSPTDHGKVILQQTVHSDNLYRTYVLIPSSPTTDFRTLIGKRPSYLAVEAIYTWAQHDSEIASVYIGFMKTESSYIAKDVNQYLSNGQSYTDAYWVIGGGTVGVNHLPDGVWRVTARFSVDGVDTLYTHVQESGGISFTAPADGTLEVISFYLYDANNDTEPGTVTVLNVYEDATNGPY